MTCTCSHCKGSESADVDCTVSLDERNVATAREVVNAEIQKMIEVISEMRRAKGKQRDISTVVKNGLMHLEVSLDAIDSMHNMILLFLDRVRETEAKATHAPSPSIATVPTTSVTTRKSHVTSPPWRTGRRSARVTLRRALSIFSVR